MDGPFVPPPSFSLYGSKSQGSRKGFAFVGLIQAFRTPGLVVPNNMHQSDGFLVVKLQVKLANAADSAAAKRGYISG